MRTEGCRVQERGEALAFAGLFLLDIAKHRSVEKTCRSSVRSVCDGVRAEPRGR